MKKLFLLVPAVFMLLVVGCKKDDAPKSSGTTDNVTKDVLVTFAKNKVLMSTSASVEVQLFGKDLKPFVANEDISIPLVVNTNSSTAEENKQFTFENNNKTIVIRKGESKGSLKMIYKDPVEVDKAHIVVNFDLSSIKNVANVKFNKGQYDMCEINIYGSYIDKLKGTWKMDKLITNETKFKETWTSMVTYNGFPTFNAEDTMTFTDEGLITDFKSEFSNYFSKKSDMTPKGEYKLKLGYKNEVDIQLIELNKINRFFSSSKVSTDDDIALLGIQVTKDENTNEEVLNIYIIDYYSKSFAPEFIEFDMYKKQKPMATDTGMFLIFTMKKVK